MEEFYLPLKIINLERRKDRKQQNIEEFKKHGISISDTHFFKAVDGKQLKITEELYELFKGNCFNYRGGVIGCALSHYYLWNQLITDNTTDYYLIMEDDCTLDTNFKRIVYQYDDLFKNNSEPNLFYMSYLQNIKYTTEPKKFVFKKFTDYNFIGGTQLYAINKCCAEELLNSIKIRGIKREIDWITSDATFGINIYELEDHIAFSDYVKNVHVRTVDSDIQYNNESLDLDENFLKKRFYFYENVDQIGNDLYNHPYCNNFFTNAKTNKSVLKHIEFLKIKKYTNQLLLKALDDDTVVAVNHLGILKTK